MSDGEFEQFLIAGQHLHAELRWHEALAHWQSASAEFIQNLLIVKNTGLACIHTGDFAKAACCFQQIRFFDAQDITGYLASGWLFEAQMNWRSAYEEYHTLSRSFPDQMEVLKGLARCLIKLGRIESAKQVWLEALVRNPALLEAKKEVKKLSQVRKSQIINAMIQTFALDSYLEYNKLSGEMALAEVSCARKSATFIAEESFCSGQSDGFALRARVAASASDAYAILELDELIQRYAADPFDIVFFDPMHVRPQVDLALKSLLKIVKPGGFLLVHDCNPVSESSTVRERKEGVWLGETYKAFVNFHQNNPARCVVVSEDHGVGIIWNQGLNLAYEDSFDLDYADFDKNREKSTGLISYARFLSLLKSASHACLVENRLE